MTVLYGPNGQPMDNGGAQPAMNGSAKTANGVLMYNRDGTPVIVGGDGVAIRGLRDFNPTTNRWAAKDTLMNLLACAMKRPAATAGVTVAAFFIVQFVLSFGIGALLALAGRSQPVALNQIQKDSASQVGYWLGTSVAAPVVQGSATTLVNFADTAAQQNATLVNFRQGDAKQYPLAPTSTGGGFALPSDTPLVQVVDGGQR